MAISAAELRSKTFEVVPKGYDRPEVHRYLNALANELQEFNNSAQTEEAGLGSTYVATGPATASPQSSEPLGVEDFDRVGNEISLMLRQAQESAMKIRSDAELEARTLVDQVRLDIEADRVAHEQAAGELIRRTDERAMSIRLSAEDYARDTRMSVEEYQQERRTAIDTEAAEAASEAAAARQMTADNLASASLEAQSTVAEANDRARSIIEDAEAEAQTRSNAILEQARATLKRLAEEEERTRRDLEDARRNIDDVLGQPKVSVLEKDLSPNSPNTGYGNV